MPAERPIVEIPASYPEVLRNPAVQALAAELISLQHTLSAHSIHRGEFELIGEAKGRVRARFAEIATTIYDEGILQPAGAIYKDGELIQRGRLRPLGLLRKTAMLVGIRTDHSDGLHNIGPRAQAWRDALDRGIDPMHNEAGGFLHPQSNTDEQYAFARRNLQMDDDHIRFLAVGQDALDLYATVGLTLALTSKIEPPTPASPTK